MNRLLFKISIWWQIKRGFIDKNFAPIKCPICKCKDIETYEVFRHDQGFIEEYWVRFKKCKNHLGVWAYGSWNL